MGPKIGAIGNHDILTKEQIKAIHGNPGANNPGFVKHSNNITTHGDRARLRPGSPTTAYSKPSPAEATAPTSPTAQTSSSGKSTRLGRLPADTQAPAATDTSTKYRPGPARLRRRNIQHHRRLQQHQPIRRQRYTRRRRRKPSRPTSQSASTTTPPNSPSTAPSGKPANSSTSSAPAGPPAHSPTTSSHDTAPTSKQSSSCIAAVGVDVLGHDGNTQIDAIIAHNQTEPITWLPWAPTTIPDPVIDGPSTEDAIIIDTPRGQHRVLHPRRALLRRWLQRGRGPRHRRFHHRRRTDHHQRLLTRRAAPVLLLPAQPTWTCS